jgi:hypothetical protein
MQAIGCGKVLLHIFGSEIPPGFQYSAVASFARLTNAPPIPITAPAGISKKAAAVVPFRDILRNNSRNKIIKVRDQTLR